MIFIPNAANIRFTYGRVAQILHGLPLAELEPGRHSEAPTDPQTRTRLERVSKVAVLTYNHAIGNCEPTELRLVLGFIEPELRGFAYEGVGMGLMILDLCTPWGRGRTDRFLQLAPEQAALTWIGAGQALGAFFRPLAPVLEPLDPSLRGFVVDGYGFRNAFFLTGRTLDKHIVPAGVPPEWRVDFDVGAGRALWFLTGADPDRIAARIAAMPEARQPALWRGVGFAATYAGGVTRAVLEVLRDKGDPHALSLGCVSACLLRVDGQHSTHRDELACSLFCDSSPQELAEARASVPKTDDAWALRAAILKLAKGSQPPTHTHAHVGSSSP